MMGGGVGQVGIRGYGYSGREDFNGGGCRVYYRRGSSGSLV